MFIPDSEVQILNSFGKILLRPYTDDQELDHGYPSDGSIRSANKWRSIILNEYGDVSSKYKNLSKWYSVNELDLKSERPNSSFRPVNETSSSSYGGLTFDKTDKTEHGPVEFTDKLSEEDDSYTSTKDNQFKRRFKPVPISRLMMKNTELTVFETKSKAHESKY